MHDEDNLFRLNVANRQGEYWRAFGDNYLLKEEASTQREIIIKAIQFSADSIFEVYKTGIMPKEDKSLALLPIYSKIADLNSTNALFKVDKKQHVLRRKSLTNPYDNSYLKYWSSITTLIALEW